MRKIANELIMSAQSLNILHLSYSTKSCLISWPARLVKPWMLQTFHVQFPVLVNHPKRNIFVIDVESQQQGILMDIVHGCSGVAYPYLMKQDFFSLRILHENSLRLPFYFQFVKLCGFSVFRIFPTGNEGNYQIALHAM